MMATVLAVATLLWHRLRHDRLGLAFTFLLPVAVAIVMVGIYSADYASAGVVVEQPGDAVGEAVFDRLERDGLIDVRRYDTQRDVEQAVRSRDVAVGVVVPSAATATTEVDLVGPPGTEAPSGVRAVVESAVAETAAALQVGRAIEPSASDSRAITLGQDELAGKPRQQLSDHTADVRRRENVALALVGALVLFVFMNTVGGASSLAELRELGILARARATSASPAAIAVGYGVGLTSYALVQAGLMLATGWLLFGVTWASWPALLAVVGLVALAAAALAVLVATLLPSADMGTTVAGPVAFLLGMLGGCLWPLDIVDPGLAQAGHVTPHAWAVEALRAVGVSGDGLGTVGMQLAVLGAGSVVMVALGGWRLVRMAARP
jgi:ABC-2 type transport system permease protein